MTQAGLGDAVAGLELVGQAVEVVEQFRVEHGHVGGDHTPEQDAAEPGCRRHRQVALTQRASAAMAREWNTSSSAKIVGTCAA